MILGFVEIMRSFYKERDRTSRRIPIRGGRAEGAQRTTRYRRVVYVCYRDMRGIVASM